MKRRTKLISLFLSLCILLNVVLAIPVQVSAANYESAVEYNNHYYKVFSDTISWHDAKKNCEAMGGNLAVITSEEENRFAFELVTKSGFMCWLGATDEIDEGIWRWVNGENWNYIPSNSEFNNAAPSQNYLVLGLFDNGGWDDQSVVFDNQFCKVEGYICEWDSFEEYCKGYLYPGIYCDSKIIPDINVRFEKDWFFSSPTSYNHNIATLCSQFLLEGYIAEENNMNGSEEDLDTGRDEMNNFIAVKDIEENGTTYHLVVVSCIGSWHMQWNSNFDPYGTKRDPDSPTVDNAAMKDINHLGFNDAKNYIYSRLRYCLPADYNKSNTKILLTGHSRGAATANLLAAKLIDEGELVDWTNLFTYTFASPNCTTNEHRSDQKYRSIFNIVYPCDFVTKVLPVSWGYGRYGVTFSLPTKTNEGKAYSGYLNRMMTYYRKLNGATEGNAEFFDYDKGEAEVRVVMAIFTSHVRNLDEFYNSDFKHGFKDTLKPFEYFQDGLCPYVNGTNNKSKALYIMGFGLAGSIVYKTLSTFFLVDQKISPRFADAHKMETYCSYMMSLTSGELTAPRKGILGTVNCPVDVEVIDNATGDVVGRIVNNVVDEEIAAKENSIVMTVDGDQKEYWLPYNGNFDVRLIGNDDGVMDYTLSEFDSDIGETSRMNFNNVTVEKDKAFNCSAEDYESEEVALTDFILTDENENEVEADEVFTSEDMTLYTVDTEVEGSGVVSESVRVASGDYVTVTASPYRSDFIGWYQDGDLVSNSKDYRFRPEFDVALTAGFTEAEYLLGDADGDRDISIIDATYLQRYDLGIITMIPDEDMILCGDVDGDGDTGILDATWILRYDIGITIRYPLGERIFR